MGVMGAEGDRGGVTAGEGREGLSEVLPSASFPISLFRGAPAKKMTEKKEACNEKKKYT